MMSRLTSATGTLSKRFKIWRTIGSYVEKASESDTAMKIEVERNEISPPVFYPGSLTIIGLAVSTVGSNALSLVIPFFSMQVFDRVITTANLSTLAMLALIATLLLIIQIMVDGARSAALGKVAARIEFRLLTFVATTGRGRNYSRSGAFADLDLVKNAVSGTTAIALLDLPFCAIFFIALYWLHPILGLIAILSLVPMSVVGFLSYHSTHKLKNQSTEHNARALSLLHQTQSVPDVSSRFRTGPRLAEFIFRQRRTASSLTLRAAIRQGWCDAALRGLRATLQICILAAAAILVVNQDVNVGTLVGASMLFARALAPVERLLAVGPGLKTVFLAGSHLSRSKLAYDKQVMAMPLPDLVGDVSFHEVSIHSETGRKIIDGVNLTLRKGTLTVIVGPEGAGKSSLLKALVGAQALTAGCIRIGGTNLMDIAPEQLEDEIGYLADDARLISASAAQTISRMREGADAKSILRAASMAGAHERIQLFPSGYQTLIGPSGHFISTGEQQRLLLARAFYQQPKLVVLDEPMVALDESGCAAVFAALEELRHSGSTIIVASRHPRFIQLMDRLIMLENGKITHDRTGAEVMEFTSLRMAARQ